MRISKYGDPVLRQKSVAFAAAEIMSSKTKTLLKGMQLTMDAESGDHNVAVGLAAPQVNVSKRLTIVRNLPEMPLFCLFNPVVEKLSDESILMMESCISIP